MRLFILALFSTCILSYSAQAMIIDLPEKNGLGYFQDTKTGYVWMDLMNTLFYFPNTAALALVEDNGFVWAEEAKVRQLELNAMSDFGISEFYRIGNDDQKFYYSRNSAFYLNKVMGGQTPWIDEPSVIGAYDEGGGFVGLTDYSCGENDTTPCESWLYQSVGVKFEDQAGAALWAYKSPIVPEPATIILFGFGLISVFHLKNKYFIRS